MADRKLSALVLLAHPNPSQSEVNLTMARAARDLDGVTLVDLYAQYPTLDIDIDLEQARLRAHDILVLHFPFYWYSTPAILKEWQDLVLEYGFAYGHEGTALHGKVMFCAVTTGGAQESYMADGVNHFTVRQLLAPLEQTANLCGMTYLPPLVLHSARSAAEEHRIAAHARAYAFALETAQADRWHLPSVAKAETLNAVLDEMEG
ncbi:MAG: NAD(P)H-dependent oxidoreductase [Pseudomonadota bacterium]